MQDKSFKGRSEGKGRSKKAFKIEEKENYHI